MIRKHFCSIFLTSFFIVIFSISGVSQDLDNVTISGKVTDSNNAPLVGATVVAKLTSTETERTVVTDGEGRFAIVKLEPGTYTVKVSAQGFGSKEHLNLVTIAGQAVQLNIELSPASVTAEQTISIDDEDIAIDTTRTVVGGTVTQREIEELPNISRNPLDLIFTLGGVAEESLSTRDLADDRGSYRESRPANSDTPEEAGLFSLSGGAAYSNNITIDGLDNNDDRSAGLRFTPSLDAVQEVQVITNQFSAEYGRASGGRVNFRTRAGGKKFRGRATYLFRDSALNANTWRNNLRGIPRTELQEHIPVFSIGGPVPFGYFKNKTFFFAAYEYQTVREDTLVDTFVPVATNSRYALPASTSPNEVATLPTGDLAPYFEEVPTPLKNHTLSARLDHKFTNNHDISFNFQYGNRRDFRQFSGGTRLAETLLGNSRETRGFSFTDNYVFSSKVINQARFQFSTLIPRNSVEGINNPVVIITIPGALDRGTSLIAGSSTLGSTDREEKRWQIQDSLILLAGSHSFKAGFDVQNVRSKYIDRGDATGTYNFASVNDFLNNNVTRYRHNFGNVSQLENTYYGIFFQDEWRIRPNISLSMGLRYENETILNDKNNFAPRMGIAWNPFKSNKGVIRFGAGIFYNRALLRTIDDNRLTLVNEAVVFDTQNLGTANAAPATVFQAISNKFPNTLTEEEVRGFCTTYNLNCTASGNFSNSMDSNIKLPESYQFNIGFEREIGKSFVFETNYTWNKTAHLWRRVSTNSISLDILNQKTGGNYSNLMEYLLSTTFDNNIVNGSRPIYGSNTGAKDALIFVTSFTAPPVGDPNRCTGTINPSNAAQGGCMRINGVQTTVMNLNGPTPATTSPQYVAAMNALNQFRPDPNGLSDAKEIKSIGNSEYSGLNLSLKRRYRNLGYGFGASFRFAYTLSSLWDDGMFNTSQAQIVGDFASEWARSLQDRRHRIAISGTFDTPKWIGKLRFSPIIRYGSSAPFNISAGGIDRNLDSVSNDRPNYSGSLDELVYRNPDSPFPQSVYDAFSLGTLGDTGGNLPRNAGRGPSYYMFDLNISRDIKFNERFKLRPNIELNNILNARVFSFGSGFINANDPQGTFLVPSRTFRPRQIRIGLRFDF